MLLGWEGGGEGGGLLEMALLMEGIRYTKKRKKKNLKDKNIKTTLQSLSWLVQAKGLKAL